MYLQESLVKVSECIAHGEMDALRGLPTLQLKHRCVNCDTAVALFSIYQPRPQPHSHSSTY